MISRHTMVIESPSDPLKHTPVGTSGHKASETRPFTLSLHSPLWLSDLSLSASSSFLLTNGAGQLENSNQAQTHEQNLFESAIQVPGEGALNAFQTIQHNRRWWSQSERTEPRPSSWMWSASRRNQHMTCHLPQCRWRVRHRHNLCLPVPMPMMSGRISSRHHPTPLLRRNDNLVDNKADHNRNVPVSSNQANIKPH